MGVHPKGERPLTQEASMVGRRRGPTGVPAAVNFYGPDSPTLYSRDGPQALGVSVVPLDLQPRALSLTIVRRHLPPYMK